MSCLYILGVKPLSVASFATILFQSGGCCFVYGFLCCAKVCKFDQVPYVCFCFYFYCIRRLTQENIATIYVRECFAYVLFQEFYGVTSLKSLSHFEFIFVCSVRVSSNFVNLHATVQLSQDCLQRACLFPIVDSLFLW